MLSDRNPFAWLKKKVGIDRPSAMSYDDWEAWQATTKKEHPVVWVLAEVLPNKIENLYNRVIEPFEKLRYAIYCAFGLKCHQVPTTLKAGTHYCFNERLVDGIFTMLVDHVEIEQAFDHVRWSKSRRKEYKKIYGLPWWLPHKWTRLHTWRNAKAGIDNLMHDMQLDYPGHSWWDEQAIRARETFELYLWWKVIRPSRPDPYMASGMLEISDQLEMKYGEGWVFSSSVRLTPEENQMYNDAAKRLDDLTQQYTDEDNEMIMRLVKHRDEIYA